MVRLIRAIATYPKVIGSPQQTGVLRLLTIGLVFFIFDGKTLCRFMDYSHNAILFGLFEVQIVAVMVGYVNYNVNRLSHLLAPFLSLSGRTEFSLSFLGYITNS